MINHMHIYYIPKYYIYAWYSQLWWTKKNNSTFIIKKTSSWNFSLVPLWSGKKSWSNKTCAIRSRQLITYLNADLFVIESENSSKICKMLYLFECIRGMIFFQTECNYLSISMDQNCSTHSTWLQSFPAPVAFPG